jgi:hypothetical protein
MKVFGFIHKINIKKVIMGLLDKIKPQERQEQVEGLTAEELKFLLLKLRTATYTGHEFETFYNIWVKISKELENLEK